MADTSRPEHPSRREDDDEPRGFQTGDCPKGAVSRETASWSSKVPLSPHRCLDDSSVPCVCADVHGRQYVASFSLRGRFLNYRDQFIQELTPASDSASTSAVSAPRECCTSWLAPCTGAITAGVSFRGGSGPRRRLHVGHQGSADAQQPADSSRHTFHVKQQRQTPCGARRSQRAGGTVVSIDALNASTSSELDFPSELRSTMDFSIDLSPSGGGGQVVSSDFAHLWSNNPEMPDAASPPGHQEALPPQPLDRVQIVRIHIRQRLLFHVKRHPVTAPLCPLSSRPQRYRALCRPAFLRSRRGRFWFARRPLQKGEGTHHEPAEEGHELLCRLSALCWPHPHSRNPRTASRRWMPGGITSSSHGSAPRFHVKHSHRRIPVHDEFMVTCCRSPPVLGPRSRTRHCLTAQDRNGCPRLFSALHPVLDGA